MRRAIVLIALWTTAALGGLQAPTWAHATTPDPLRQSVGADEAVGSGRVVVERGHLDLGPRVSGGRWDLALRDDTGSAPVWRHPEDVVIRVRDSARLTVPDTDAYAFLGDARGQTVHVVPQTERSGVVWLGWNTQDPAASAVMGRGATLRLKEVKGPGRVHLFLQDGAFGKPRTLWDSTSREAQEVFAQRNTHVHANWVFTAPGSYLVRVQVVGGGDGKATYAATRTLRFAVGDSTAAGEVAALPVAAGGPDAAGASPPEAAGPARRETADVDATPGFAWTLAATVAGALMLLALGLALVSRRRGQRLRREVGGR